QAKIICEALKKRVFISGPIQGMENNQSYRKVIRDICLRCGFESVDPWLREKVLYRAGKVKKLDMSSAGFIKRDLEDIERCDILVAYLPRLSAGTCMELFYAKLKGKRTITICELENPSPWIIAHSDILLGKIMDLEEYLKKEL
ncbi:nucleoside 2-deoxyribosyltransferase, partial [Candidatus Bathyarchaeota archaeon]|nr:nucleoside 2-deoxyribosyltransferase [Candidatus Bathyarchaeota archaeon]